MTTDEARRAECLDDYEAPAHVHIERHDDLPWVRVWLDDDADLPDEVSAIFPIDVDGFVDSDEDDDDLFDDEDDDDDEQL